MPFRVLWTFSATVSTLIVGYCMLVAVVYFSCVSAFVAYSLYALWMRCVGWVLFFLAFCFGQPPAWPPARPLVSSVHSAASFSRFRPAWERHRNDRIADGCRLFAAHRLCFSYFIHLPFWTNGLICVCRTRSVCACVAVVVPFRTCRQPYRCNRISHYQLGHQHHTAVTHTLQTSKCNRQSCVISNCSVCACVCVRVCSCAFDAFPNLK